MKIGKLLFTTFAVLIATVLFNGLTYAQPYGKGIYNADVPYGSATYLSIATSGDVAIPISPNESGVLGSGTSTVTVVSTDVVGYKLYIRGLTSTMSNRTARLNPSSNMTPGPLTTNTWGYNIDQSNNYMGITTADRLIKNTVGPVKNGENTIVKYGVQIDYEAAAGLFDVGVVYTAVPQTD